MELFQLKSFKLIISYFQSKVWIRKIFSSLSLFSSFFKKHLKLWIKNETPKLNFYKLIKCFDELKIWFELIIVTYFDLAWGGCYDALACLSVLHRSLQIGPIERHQIKKKFEHIIFENICPVKGINKNLKTSEIAYK